MSEFFSYTDQDISIEYGRDVRPVPSDFKMHTHECYELYYFIGGSGIYRVEGTPYPLEKGDILIMRPTEVHYVEITDEKPYTRMWVNFGAGLLKNIDPGGRLLAPFNDRKIGTNNRYRAENFRNGSYKSFINNIIADAPDRRVQTIANLLPLLNEISIAFDTMSEASGDRALDGRIISYINRHITEDVSLDDLCERFFISKSHLCRIFKKATASSVGEYITVKRLATAKQLMLSGVAPTKAYLEAGFKDYSVFWRAYKKKYGASPSAAFQPPTA